MAAIEIQQVRAYMAPSLVMLGTELNSMSTLFSSTATSVLIISAACSRTKRLVTTCTYLSGQSSSRRYGACCSAFLRRAASPLREVWFTDALR